MVYRVRTMACGVEVAIGLEMPEDAPKVLIHT